MIEIVYKEEKKEANGNEEFFYLPKNIRQIGEIKGVRKIYVEDYVYTFLKRMGTDKESTGHIAVLMGKYKWTEGNSYLFIQSAMELQDMEVSMEHLQFTDKEWGEVHDTREQYFKGQEILGWVLSIPGVSFEMNDVIRKTHLNYFAGSDKVLLVMEPTEKEEAFYCYEDGRMQREGGYYIYYEKNEAMQEYMIAYGKNKPIEETEKIPDRAVANFRKALEQKQEPMKEEETKTGHTPVYALAACVAAAVLAVGFSYASDKGALPGILSRFNQSIEKVEETAGLTGQELDGSVNGNSRQDESMGEGEQRKTVETAADTSAQTSQENKNLSGEPSAIPSETPAASSAGDTTSVSAETPSSVTAGTSIATKEYIVKKGDTLSKICMANYGDMSKVQQICELNNLADPEVIFEGQKLRLPQ